MRKYRKSEFTDEEIADLLRQGKTRKQVIEQCKTHSQRVQRIADSLHNDLPVKMVVNRMREEFLMNAF